MNVKEKTLIKDFLKGDNYTQIIKDSFKKQNWAKLEDKFWLAGEYLGLAHSLDLRIGDTKPENFLCH